MTRMDRVVGTWLTLCFSLSCVACEDKAKVSREHAARHVEHLVGVAAADVEEIRRGLPQGAKLFADLWKEEKAPESDLRELREALSLSRDKVQDLRIAKSTFFAIISREGLVLRNDQEQDRMAGKDFFSAFPGARAALGGKYVETTGSLKEAAGVDESRKDAQWVAVAPAPAEEARVLFATGWSWASYVYRLEFNLRSEIRAELIKQERRAANEALVYVFVVSGPDVFGAPTSPEINIETIGKLNVLSKTEGNSVYGDTLEITRRAFGVAAKRAPALGADVAIAVLRSET